MPSQWVSVIKTAKKAGKLYKVTELNTCDILDLKDLTQQMGHNFSRNENNKSVNWSNMKILEVRKENPYVIYYKQSYEQQDFDEISIRRIKGRCPQIVLRTAYSSAPGIDSRKKKDLLDLCKSGVIPSVHAGFYNSLKVGCHTDDNANDE